MSELKLRPPIKFASGTAGRAEQASLQAANGAFRRDGDLYSPAELAKYNKFIGGPGSTK